MNNEQPTKDWQRMEFIYFTSGNRGNDNIWRDVPNFKVPVVGWTLSLMYKMCLLCKASVEHDMQISNLPSHGLQYPTQEKNPSACSKLMVLKFLVSTSHLKCLFFQTTWSSDRSSHHFLRHLTAMPHMSCRVQAGFQRATGLEVRLTPSLASV